jgi:ribosome-binding factor A
MRRVNEAVKEVLSSQLVEGMKDPRIGFVTVTGVETSPDLRFARVYVSVLGDEDERRATLDALASSRGFLQARIGEQLRMKRTPALSFQYDETVERADRMSRLIDEVAPREDDE